MKIGKFSEINKLSIDTIRHYMNLDLILPSKNGTQYEFDEACQKDLEDILIFKSMGFELKEIKSIFYYKRLASLTQYEENEYYKEIFESKYEEIDSEIELLLKNKGMLEEKISEISSKSTMAKRKIGIDIKVLSDLCCAKCRGDLSLVDGNIENNQVINGKLKCDCGEEYVIDDGILIVDTIQQEFEEIKQTRIIDYINNTNSNYLDNMYKGHEILYKNINLETYENKTMLELGSGLGFFLRRMYEHIPSTSIYIAVDHDINRHRFLKSALEKADEKKNIVFICSDFLNLPIKENQIDVLFDISGSSNYGFEHEKFLLNSLDSYAKEKSELIGSYIIFKNFNKNSDVKECYRKNFSKSFIKDSINSLGYKKRNEFVSDLVDEGGIYEPYFQEGEKVYFYIFHGKR
ncbi:MerR family transcriptional regulator [Clostridium intestinale]|uniref:MerR family transcriptional regulator n=1 Tax=Clostridium intestinale TaxID=36845 RepID=A0A7D6ZU83_9CLOT|nr:MerR family transcriptional regulator [Clostridium intestinale]QLY79873.1 MerR family transcriptional regulator [Clostridium intestinale]